MNQCILKMWFLVLLGLVRVPGQSQEQDCNLPLEHQAQAEKELHAWLESLDRRPCVDQREGVRPGVVSARSLAHKPLPKARQEFDRGMLSRRKGLAAEAVEHFAAAARLDPNFVDANAWAALVHVEVRQPSLALPYYQQAVRLEPANAILLSNLAGVLIALDRPAQAEPVARRSVQLAPSSVEAHFMLGLALFTQGKVTQETFAHLTAAAGTYPRAREILARTQFADELQRADALGK